MKFTFIFWNRVEQRIKMDKEERESLGVTEEEERLGDLRGGGPAPKGSSNQQVMVNFMYKVWSKFGACWFSLIISHSFGCS